MERYRLFFVTSLSLAIFPTLVRLQITTEAGSLSLVSNKTRTCTCPGDTVTFTCTTIGGEATLWSGSIDCNITLNHSKFSDTRGVSGFCSDRGIVGLSVEGNNNRYTSQLTVPVNSDSINRTVECTVIYNSTVASLIGTEVIATTEPFPPPDDFRLSHINFLQRLQFTWTMNDTYRNCPSLFRIYLYNCSSTCKFSRGIVCSDISTVAQICLFQLQYSICDDIRGNASNLVNVTLKVPEAPVIISATISASLSFTFLDINFTQAEEFPISDGVIATIDRYNITFMQTSTGNICGSSRTIGEICQKGFCIDSVLIPSFCEGSAISIMISAINDLGSGPDSKSFNVQGIPARETHVDSSALQALVGGVVGGALTLIGALISLILALFKLNVACRQFKTGTNTVYELKETSTTKTITLQWNPPTKMSKGVTAYRVECSENKPLSLKKSVDISVEETSFKITELIPGTEYQLNVRTVTAKGTGIPAEIIAKTKDQQYKLSVQVTFSIRNKTGTLTSVLNKIIIQGFKIHQIRSFHDQCERPRGTEYQFCIIADCVCLVLEDKKQEMEKVLKTKTCARGITIKVLEEAKMEADNEEQEILEQSLPYCVIFKSTALHQAIIDVMAQFSDLNVKVAHIESFESPDSNGIYIIRVECDFGDEETKAELEARLKSCTNILDDSKFLMASETHEESEAPAKIAGEPCECILRINFPLCDTIPLMSILQILEKQGLSIMYVDSFEITSSPDSVQQYVSIEYVQQVKVDRENPEIVIRELESIHEDASVEEVFCSDLSPESHSKNDQHFLLELTMEDSREKTVALLRILTDLGVCVDSLSSQTLHQDIQNCTVKCTTKSLQFIHKNLVTTLKEIAFNSQVNLQEITSQVDDEDPHPSNS